MVRRGGSQIRADFGGGGDDSNATRVTLPSYSDLQARWSDIRFSVDVPPYIYCFRCHEPLCIHVRTMVRDQEDWWLWYGQSWLEFLLPMFEDITCHIRLAQIIPGIFSVVTLPANITEFVEVNSAYFNDSHKIGHIGPGEGISVIRVMMVDHLNGLPEKYKKCLAKLHGWAEQQEASRILREVKENGGRPTSESLIDLWRRIYNQRCKACWDGQHQDWSQFAPMTRGSDSK